MWVPDVFTAVASLFTSSTLTGNEVYRCVGIADCGICVASDYCQWCTIVETGEGFCTEMNQCPRRTTLVDRETCHSTGVSCGRCTELEGYLFRVAGPARGLVGPLGDEGPLTELSGLTSACVPATACTVPLLPEGRPWRCFGASECGAAVSAYVYGIAFANNDTNITALMIAFFITMIIITAFA